MSIQRHWGKRVLKLLSDSIVSACLFLFAIWYSIPVVSGAIYPVLGSFDIMESEWSPEGNTLSFIAEVVKIRDCGLSEPPIYHSQLQDGADRYVKRSDSSPIHIGPGYNVIGPISLSGVPKDAVSIRAVAYYDCFGQWFRPLRVEFLLPLEYPPKPKTRYLGEDDE